MPSDGASPCPQRQSEGTKSNTKSGSQNSVAGAISHDGGQDQKPLAGRHHHARMRLFGGASPRTSPTERQGAMSLPSVPATRWPSRFPVVVPALAVTQALSLSARRTAALPSKALARGGYPLEVAPKLPAPRHLRVRCMIALPRSGRASVDQTGAGQSAFDDMQTGPKSLSFLTPECEAADRWWVP